SDLTVVGNQLAFTFEGFVGDIDRAELACRGRQTAVGIALDAADGEADTQGEAFAARTLEPGFKAQLPTFHVGGPADGTDRSGGNALPPDATPDPRGTRVPNRVGLELPVLLASRPSKVVATVLSADDDSLWTVRAEQRGAVGVDG